MTARSSSHPPPERGCRGMRVFVSRVLWRARCFFMFVLFSSMLSKWHRYIVVWNFCRKQHFTHPDSARFFLLQILLARFVARSERRAAAVSPSEGGLGVFFSVIDRFFKVNSVIMFETIDWWILLRRVLIILWSKWLKCLGEKNLEGGC